MGIYAKQKLVLNNNEPYNFQVPVYTYKRRAKPMPMLQISPKR